MNDDPQQALLAALARRYGGAEFSARSAAADIPGTMWSAAGVNRPDANSCGRWLRARRGPGLTGRPSRSGVVQWRVRGPTGPAAALQAPVPATSAPQTPLAQQAPPRAPAPPAPPAPTGGPPQHAQPAQQLPWWVPSAPAVDAGLPGPRWGCGRWWSPLPEAAS